MTSQNTHCPATGACPLAATDYRNIFAQPGASLDLYRGLTQSGGGITAADRRATRDMLKKLAARMTLPFDWSLSRAQPAPTSEGSSEIPAGYTYLAQLVAHDMVQSVASVDAIGEHEGVPRNMRRAGLVLDTIYGAGPLMSPMAYASEGRKPMGQRRIRLRLSKARLPKDDTGGSPYRDLPRVTSPIYDRTPSGDLRALNDFDWGTLAKLRSTYFENALINDPRNDDNLFVSQLTVAFHLLHNALVADVADRQDDLPARLQPKSDLHRFRIARQLAVCAYRRVVRHDLLKHLLIPPVHAQFEQAFDAQAQPSAPADDHRMPVEFSHAAFRFGHAMVRPHYRINDQLLDFSGGGVQGDKRGTISLKNALDATSNDRLRTLVPFDRHWWVEWRHFFRFPGLDHEPQFARHIAPYMEGEMARDDLVAHFDQAEKGGLPFRDVVRSVEIGTQTVASLYREVELRGLSAPNGLQDPEVRRDLIRTWLLQEGDLGFTEAELVSLSENPPLAFYVLFEAAVEAGGRTLGTLGSTIVADTLYRELARSRHAFEDNADLAVWCRAVFGDGGPTEASGLFSYVASRIDLTGFI